MVGEGDDQIVFTIVSIEGDRVRIGIDAPRDVNIVREELLRKQKDRNEERE